jgi:hypothetical protein
LEIFVQRLAETMFFQLAKIGELFFISVLKKDMPLFISLGKRTILVANPE